VNFTTSGDFEITINDRPVFSKHSAGNFPIFKDVKSMLNLLALQMPPIHVFDRLLLLL
jgi:selT/selW/selH-like putative selenoprotein